MKKEECESEIVFCFGYILAIYCRQMMIHLTNNDNVVLITERSRRSKATNEIRSSGAASRGMTKGSEHHHHHGRGGKAKTAGKEKNAHRTLSQRHHS